MNARLRRMAQAVLVCVILVTELVPAFSNAPLTIVVVLSRDAAPYRQALRGFEEVLKDSHRAYKIQEFSTEAVAVDGGEEEAEGVVPGVGEAAPADHAVDPEAEEGVGAPEAAGAQEGGRRGGWSG